MGHLSSIQSVTVLIAEDSDLDFLLLQHALEETQTHLQVKRAWDGTEVLEYLKGGGRYTDRMIFPFP
ncbi:MAG: hypothetical protein JWQ83_2258, partial [Lacunisphaera sp.]|nr:hypothetical protein [Lacunisphaera sp.]